MICSCTTYRARPLPAQVPPQALPAEAVLTERIAALHHPLLPPMHLVPGAPLDQDAIAVLAVCCNPELVALRDQRGIAQAQVLQAGLLPNPTLDGGLAFPYGHEAEGTALGYDVGLSWDVTAWITRGARRASAVAGASAIDLGIAWREWVTALDAQQAYVRLLGARQRLAVAMTVAERAEQDQRDAQGGVEHGLLPAAAVDACAAAAHAARAQAADAAETVAAESLALHRLLGIDPRDALPLADPPDAASLPPTDALLHDLERRRLDLQALRQGYAAQEQLLRAAVRAQFPRIVIGASRQRDTFMAQSVGPQMSVELPVFDRNQGRIAAEAATRQQLYDDYCARAGSARADLLAAADAWGRDRDRLQELDRALARSRARCEVLRTQWLAGDITAESLREALTGRDALAIERALWRQRLAESLIAAEAAAGWFIPAAGTHGA